MADFDPTHSLLVRAAVSGTDEHRSILLAAFESSPASGATSYRTTDLSEATDVLASLLAQREKLMRAPRELEFCIDGTPVFQYVPEHGKVTLDDDAAPGLAAAVADEVADRRAVVVPMAAVAAWEHDSIEYSVGPSLCRGQPERAFDSEHCYHLDRLVDVTADADDLTIDLEWDRSDRGPILGALGATAKALGWSRPETLHFESERDFVAARDALRGIADGLAGNRGKI